jgi:hypothetical protein
MKKSITTSSVVGLFFALGLTPPAFAADGKIYAAAECVDASSSGNARYSYGRAYNTSTLSNLYMECPVVKETVADTSLQDGHFYVKDMHYLANISCTLATQSATSTGPWGWYTTRSSTGTSTSPQKLSYSSQPMYANSGYTVFKCTVPPRYNGNPSYLVSYRVDE